MNSHAEIQDKLLKTYMSLLEKGTIREMSSDCKIQSTRIFRLMNGHEMKLTEYLKVQERVIALSCGKSELLEDAFQCEKSLSGHGINEISKIMKRKVRLSKLVNQSNNIKIAA
jgi:hypothetical protein